MLRDTYTSKPGYTESDQATIKRFLVRALSGTAVNWPGQKCYIWKGNTPYSLNAGNWQAAGGVIYLADTSGAAGLTPFSNYHKFGVLLAIADVYDLKEDMDVQQATIVMASKIIADIWGQVDGVVSTVHNRPVRRLAMKDRILVAETSENVWSHMSGETQEIDETWVIFSLGG